MDTKMEKRCTSSEIILYPEKQWKTRNRIDVRLVNNKKDCLKCTPKLKYILHNIFDNNLVSIRKRKVALKLNKPAYITLECASWN